MIIHIDDDFDLVRIAESGQCFRWEKRDAADDPFNVPETITYRIIAGGTCLYITALGNAADVMEAERIVFLLKENEIPSYHQESSSSVVAYGVSGFGLYGVDVFVNDCDAAQAKSIVESLQESD